MNLHLARTAFIALLVVGFTGSAQAATFDYELAFSAAECEAMGCEGSSLFLGVNEVSGGWEITYTIDTVGYYGDQLGFNQIGFKVIKDWDVGPNNLVLSQPSTSSDGWAPIFDDPIAANSLCDTSNGDTDKVCMHGFVVIDPNKIITEYTWVVFIEGGTLMDVNEWHLGAQYANSRYRSPGHIISAQVPEPTAAVLFGLGAILVTRSARRR